MGEGGASVATDLRYQTTQCEHYSWWHRTSSLLPWMCFKVKNWKKKMSCVPQKNQTCCKKFFLVNCCSLNKCTVFTRIIPPPSWASMDIFWNHKYRIINSIFLVEYYLIWFTNKDNITGIKLALCGNYFYKFVFWKVLSGKLQPSCSSWWL